MHRHVPDDREHALLDRGSLMPTFDLADSDPEGKNPRPLNAPADETATNPQSAYVEPEDVAHIHDTHSQAVGVLDVHSVHVDRPAVAVAKAPAEAAPAGPVVKATKQATQAAVNTAKQATQQVEAAMQQQAQRITVAPRKAVYRGKRFLLVYAVLTAVFGVLAVLARRHKYFPVDVQIARLIQKPKAEFYDALMHTVSQLGWRWPSVTTRAVLSLIMWLAGFRMESAFTLGTWSGDIVSALIKISVLRPRPTRELVQVVSELKEFSFPSGHVVHYVTFYGFLFYLVYIHLKQRWFRTALLTLLAGVILLVGPSRVYMGHHWPSDVAGAYLVGTLWLGVIIIAYLETKANYTLHTHPPFLIRRPARLG